MLPDAAPADWRAAAALIAAGISLFGVLVSLFWNWYNWRRNRELDALTRRNAAAIRFETVHGDALTNVSAQLNEVAEVANRIRTRAQSIEESRSLLTEELRGLLARAEHAFTIAVRDLTDSKLARNNERWRSLVGEDWDILSSAYSSARRAEGISDLHTSLDALSNRALSIRQAILAAREAENSLD